MLVRCFVSSLLHRDMSSIAPLQAYYICKMHCRAKTWVRADRGGLNYPQRGDITVVENDTVRGQVQLRQYVSHLRILDIYSHNDHRFRGAVS